MRKFNWLTKACGLLLLCATTGVALPAQTFTTLLSFDNTDGASPQYRLVQATDGNLYGTAEVGGANNGGTVFKITRLGALTTLYNFCSLSGCMDGESPYAGLVQGTDGNFYGTTNLGGASGDGTVFKITPSGTLTTLHSFDGTDGSTPQAGLVLGSDGDFYGATLFGAARYGTIFKITPSGTLTTLHRFTDRGDGGFPYLAPSLIQATNGDFYGTTYTGGAYEEGTVFRMTASGMLTTIYSFCQQGVPCPDGGNPTAGLVQGMDGSFYGAVARGGNASCSFSGFEGCGTVFTITPGGTLTTLHTFDGTDGATPVAGLVQDTNGKFYGTAPTGGASGYGTVFNLSVGLVPFVETQPASGKVGAAVKVLGTNLTGATSVTFNGTSAAFTVKSQSEITTTVPVGATTGTIQVVTPISTFLSNVAFTVKP